MYIEYLKQKARRSEVSPQEKYFLMHSYYHSKKNKKDVIKTDEVAESEADINDEAAIKVFQTELV